MTGEKGADGVSPIVTENANNSDTIYKLDIVDANGTRTTPNLIGRQGVQGLRGDKGDVGEKGEQGIQGIAGTDGVSPLITTNTANTEDVYKLDITDANGTFTTPNLIGRQGVQGIQGEAGKDGTTYTPSIGEVTTVESNVEASATVSVNTETKKAVFNFAIPKGKDGDRNADTVNNHTVKSDVSENAVFTDTVYDDTELNAKLNGKADKNAVLNSLEVVNGNVTTQIIPWNDGTHYRGFEDKSNNTYTDIITKDGVASIAKVENGVMKKNEELATMNKVANSIIREGKSVLYNLNNVDNIEVAIDIAKSGYKPIAVSLYNAGTHLWFAQGMYFNDTVCNLSLRGVAPTSATNAECKVLVTYIKTS